MPQPSSFVVVANCQGEPLARFIRLLTGLDDRGTVFNYRSRPAERERDLERYRSADVIFGQLTFNPFPSDHVTSAFLQETFSDKLILFPNVYFTGQTLGLRSVFDVDVPGKPRMIRGNFEDKHLTPVFLAWLAGVPEHQCRERLGEFEPDGAAMMAEAESSLQELRAREARCDVAISDVIAERWLREPLFFLFNHPRAVLLIELATRLAARAGLTVREVLTPAVTGEPLGNTIVPSLPFRTHDVPPFAFPQGTVGYGPQYTVRDGAITIERNGPRRLDELIADAYALYGAQCADTKRFELRPGREVVQRPTSGVSRTLQSAG